MLTLKNLQATWKAGKTSPFQMPLATYWQLAMASKLQSMHDNCTWLLVLLPPGKRSIQTQWIFKLKPGINGSPMRYKARLVAWSFQQQHGIDYQEIFVPIVRWETIKTVAALAFQN